jgi:hypothetical protein
MTGGGVDESWKFATKYSWKHRGREADADRVVEDITAFRDFFPEYGQLPLVGILASFAVDDSVLNYPEKQGFLVLAVGDELMEINNRPGSEPRRW